MFGCGSLERLWERLWERPPPILGQQSLGIEGMWISNDAIQCRLREGTCSLELIEFCSSNRGRTARWSPEKCVSNRNIVALDQSLVAARVINKHGINEWLQLVRSLLLTTVKQDIVPWETAAISPCTNFLNCVKSVCNSLGASHVSSLFPVAETLVREKVRTR